MKYALMCIVNLSLVACVDSSTSPELSGPEGAPIERAPASSAPSVIDTCSTQSVGFCAGQPFGTLCHANPRRWCLWSNELPNGELLCECGENISN